jgi:hypothetical protein
MLSVCSVVVFLSCLWWPANYVVVGEVAATIGEKKKKDASVILGC